MSKTWSTGARRLLTHLSALKGTDFAPLKNLVTIAAILVGGYWTVHEYHSTLKPRLAAAQLAELSRDAINISLNASPLPAGAATARDVMIRVQLENQGACIATFSLDRGWQPLYVAHVDVTEDRLRPRTGEELFPQSYAILSLDADHVPIAVLNVPAKTTRQLAYYVQVREPGVYFIRFHSPIGLSPPCGPGGRGIAPPKAPDFDFRSKSAHVRDLLAKTPMWLATTFVVVP